jgi:hypothetical protein
MMRIWSIHPSYLDSIGLVALWREGLLAKKVVEGRTAGYRCHPQLARFYNHETPIEAINSYLNEVWREADLRGYAFDRSKYVLFNVAKIPLSRGQLEYEYEHFLKKLEKRNPKKHKELESTDASRIRPHPIFDLFEGTVEDWEKV